MSVRTFTRTCTGHPREEPHKDSAEMAALTGYGVKFVRERGASGDWPCITRAKPGGHAYWWCPHDEESVLLILQAAGRS